MPLIQPSHCLSVADQENVPDVLRRREAAEGEIEAACLVQISRTVLQRERRTRTELHHHAGGNIVQLLPNAATDAPPWKKPLYGENARTKGVDTCALNASVSSSLPNCGAALFKKESKDMFL